MKRQEDGLSKWLDDRPYVYVPLDEPIQRATSDVLRDHPLLMKATKNRNGGDPFVIATAQVLGLTVVTEERGGSLSKPKIPSVCQALGVRHRRTGVHPRAGMELHLAIPASGHLLRDRGPGRVRSVRHGRMMFKAIGKRRARPYFSVKRREALRAKLNARRGTGRTYTRKATVYGVSRWRAEGPAARVAFYRRWMAGR